MADSIGQLVAKQITGVPSANVLAHATDEDLILARERTRSLVAMLRDLLAPLAWLYGKGGAAFRVMGRLLDSLAPADYVSLVALMVLLAPAIPPAALAALDAESELEHRLFGQATPGPATHPTTPTTPFPAPLPSPASGRPGQGPGEPGRTAAPAGRP